MAIQFAAKGLVLVFLLVLAPSSGLAQDNPKSTPQVNTQPGNTATAAGLLEQGTLLAQRDAYYERCANICQQQVDEDIGSCPGGREIQRPDDRTPPVPGCKRKAVGRFERCLASCPSPPTSSQG